MAVLDYKVIPIGYESIPLFSSCWQLYKYKLFAIVTISEKIKYNFFHVTVTVGIPLCKIR